jgi:hypothetical protein
MEGLETRCLAQSGRYPMEFMLYFAISLLPGEPSVHALMFPPRSKRLSGDRFETSEENQGVLGYAAVDKREIFSIPNAPLVAPPPLFTLPSFCFFVFA